MKTKRLLSVFVLFAVALLPLGALCEGALFQVSTLQALMQGDYYGAAAVGTLVTRGDTGLGTFNRLNGEMVMLDGVVYRAAYEGGMEAVAPDETTPFANVAFIGDGGSVESSFEGGYDGLTTALSALVPDRNMPVVFRVAGTFADVTVRSVPEQEEPYPPLTEVVKKQAVFAMEQVKGVIAGFRFPEYMGDINTTGYHLHFLSDDHTFGGHLLDAASGEISVQYCELNEFNMVLPDSISLYSVTETTDEDIEAVESQ